MHSNLNILHVEDEVLDQKAMRYILTDLGFQNIIQCRNTKEAAEAIEENQIDLAIMDIILEGSDEDGISYAMSLANQHDIPILFTSSLSDESTLERTCLLPDSEYIVKPVSERQLFVSLKKLLVKYLLSEEEVSGIRLSSSSYFLVKSNTKFYTRIDKADVLYLEASKGGTIIHYKEGKQFVYIKLHTAIQQLNIMNLIRCHISYAFSVENLEQYSDEEVILNSGKNLPISRSYKKQVKSKLQNLMIVKN